MNLDSKKNCFLEYNLSKSVGVRMTSNFYGYVQKVRGATGNIEPVELEDKKPLG